MWNTEDRARETVNTEARSIAIMENYIEFDDGPSRDGLYKLIQDYGKGGAGEWDTMTVAASGEAEVALRGNLCGPHQGFSRASRTA